MILSLLLSGALTRFNGLVLGNVRSKHRPLACRFSGGEPILSTSPLQFEELFEELLEVSAESCEVFLVHEEFQDVEDRLHHDMASTG